MRAENLNNQPIIIASKAVPLTKPQVLHVSQRERETDVEHHSKANDLGAGLEVAERVRSWHRPNLRDRPAPLKDFALTLPRDVQPRDRYRLAVIGTRQQVGQARIERRYLDLELGCVPTSTRSRVRRGFGTSCGRWRG